MRFERSSWLTIGLKLFVYQPLLEYVRAFTGFVQSLEVLESAWFLNAGIAQMIERPTDKPRRNTDAGSSLR